MVAAAAAAVAFLLTWALRELPLRRTAAAEGLGESFAAPRPADSLGELARALTALADRENRWGVYERLAARAGLTLTPPEVWLLARLAERAPITVAGLAGALRVDREEAVVLVHRLQSAGLVRNDGDGCLQLSDTGRAAADGLLAARRQALTDLLAGWAPEAHAEIRQLIDRVAGALTSEIPARA
jgi:DNA-binding MarR family transcriptional regulator